MHTLEITTISHPGGRDEQQDATGHWQHQDHHLIVVADGVGGSAGGAAASQAVIDTAAAHWEQKAGHFDSPEADLTEIAHDAHNRIANLDPHEKRRPASTMVALYMDQQNAYWIHCGDSRLYWLRNGVELERTRDHSVVQMLLEDGKITAAEVNSHPDKGRILKSLGASTFKGVDFGSCAYQTGDAFCLCSDGYWESIPHDAKILPPKPSNLSLKEYARQQVAEAVSRNGPGSDNTTLAIAYAKPPDIQAHSEPAASTPVPPQAPSTLKSVLTVIFFAFIILDIILIFYFLSTR